MELAAGANPPGSRHGGPCESLSNTSTQLLPPDIVLTDESVRFLPLSGAPPFLSFLAAMIAITAPELLNRNYFPNTSIDPRHFLLTQLLITQRNRM